MWQWLVGGDGGAQTQAADPPSCGAANVCLQLLATLHDLLPINISHNKSSCITRPAPRNLATRL